MTASSGTALLVDPAYGVGDLLDLAAADGMTVVGALVTHHHPDHVGGSMMGYRIEGLAELLTRAGRAGPRPPARKPPWSPG